ncbi:MAG: hypothetical protein U9R69_01360, partial [Thermodesulfobacteriota bacterium]|nr:hypothetical protein [Thermodesulfobacteriota bacterium]
SITPLKNSVPSISSTWLPKSYPINVIRTQPTGAHTVQIWVSVLGQHSVGFVELIYIQIENQKF